MKPEKLGHQSTFSLDCDGRLVHVLFGRVSGLTRHMAQRQMSRYPPLPWLTEAACGGTRGESMGAREKRLGSFSIAQSTARCLVAVL